MATAYVSSSGSAAYPGTVSAPTSLALAFSSAAAGDIVYIAPGTYRGTFTLGVSGSSGNTIQFIGDVGATQNISGISPGIVRVTNVITDTVFPTNATMLTATSRSYWSFENIYFEGYGTSQSQSALSLTTCSNFSFTKCTFVSQRQSSVVMTTSAGVAVNASFSKCTFATSSTGIVFGAPSHSGNYSVGLTITDCLSLANLISMATSVGGSTNTNGGNVVIYNCTAFGTGTPLVLYSSNTATPSVVRNSIFLAFNGFIHGGTTGSCDEDYNVVWGDYFSMNVGANTIRGGTLGLDYGFSALAGISAPSFFGPYLGSRAIANGVASGAPATDIDGVSWYQTTPDRASYTFAGRNNVIRFFNPSDTNSITIAPGSTSQSIELYLGATGLTASTSGLSAYYNRTRSADVQINLQARNITQNWTSGGFAEVNPNTMPGVYRLDIPNEALAAGADDVTVVVRGASGTNGAVMSIKLSSGGLTTAQTASAVWGALTNDHTTHGTFGWNVLRADQDSKEGLVTLHQSGGISRVDADVHAIANDTAAATALKGALNHDGTGYVDSDVVRISTSTAAANELEGALLHNGTDYIDSNLLSGNSTRVFVGRFQLTQTGTTQGDIIEAFTTDTPSFELQLFDGDNNIVPVTGATLGLRILDVTSTVVETGTPTIEYGTGGIVRWTAPGSYVSIGCPAGMYRLFVDRTVSGTTTTFGPLQIKVQVQ